MFRVEPRSTIESWLGQPLNSLTANSQWIIPEDSIQTQVLNNSWVSFDSTIYITQNTNSFHWNLDPGTTITFNTIGENYFVLDHRGVLTYKEIKKRNDKFPIILNKYNKLPRAVNSNFANSKDNEIVALKLLRTMISSEEFRRYLKCGIVIVKGQSGLQYQIERKSHYIIVRDFGKKICKICIYVKDYNIPPTDEVVTKIFMCECDELEVWKRGNLHFFEDSSKFTKPTTQEQIIQILKAA